MADTIIRIVEASCVASAALVLDVSLAVRLAVGAVCLASLVSDLTTTAEGSAYPFRENRGQGICIAMSILPVVFASQLALKPYTDGSHVPFLFKLSVVSAGLLLFQLRRRKSFQFVYDRLTIAAIIASAFLAFSYLDFLKGLLLVFMHHSFVPSLIYSLPNTFTLGEAYLVAFFLASVVYNGVASIVALSFTLIPLWSLLSPIVGLKDDPFMILSQYALLALMLIIASTSFLIPNLKSDERNVAEFWARFVFIGCAFDLLLLFILEHEPVFYVIKLVFEQPARLALVLWWLVIVSLSLTFFKRLENWLQCRIILSRKLYHFLITLVVIPGILVDVHFLSFSFIIALGVFSVCELIRIAQISKISSLLQHYMFSYINNSKEPALAGRDCGPVILAHIYLLIGCAFPVWLHLSFVDMNDGRTLLPAFAGVLALGVCDSTAAFVGIRFGTVHWPGSRRTLQGSFAAFLSALVSLVFLNLYLCQGRVSIGILALPALGLSVMEASLNQVDNLFLPLFFYSCLNTVTTIRNQEI